MPAITQRINNFLGGVSTQPDPKKLPGQVRDAKNVYPDVALGLTKRPGFKFLDNLVDASGNDITTDAKFRDGKWFYINRDNDEVYVGCFAKDTANPLTNLHIWNLVPDGSGNVVRSTITYTTAGGANPQAYACQSSQPAIDLEVVTVQDTSVIVNKATTVAASAAPTYNTSYGTVIINTIEYSADYKITLEIVGGSSYTKTVHTRNADVFSDSGTTDTLLNADEILTSFKTQFDAESLTGFTFTKGANSLEIKKTTSGAFRLDVSAGTSGRAMTSFTDEVETQADLPSSALHDRIVKVVNTKTQLDPFYVKFVANKGTGVSEGYWEETISPSVSTGLDVSTMPVELINTGTNAFTLKQIDYTQRLVGDDDTNSHPSFVGKKITGAFFHSNRLGFLSDDNVILSQAGDFFNFYHTTATNLVAADPVDLSCSSTRPLQLTAAVPAPNGLILLSQNQQFLMFSESGSLTPRDSRITGLSNYEVDKDIPPVEVGTSFYFVSKTDAFSRIFSFTLTGVNTPPSVVDIGKVVTEYVPSTMTNLHASPQNSLVMLYGETTNTVYFYKFYSAGQDNEMQAWFKWVLPGKPLSLNIEKDVMYAVIDAGTSSPKMFACTLNITSTPAETIVVSSAGNSVNPFMDFYAPASAVAAVSGNTRITLPFTDIAELDPVILIKGEGGTSSEGGRVDFDTAVASGFTADVVRETSGGTTYFSVEGRDLTSSGASNIIVGYKYAYDVQLPTLYFQQTPDGRRSDYSAYLGINRIKVSAGQSSTFAVKLKVKGREGKSSDFVGNASTTNFPLTFTPIDKNDLLVRVAGVDTTFTYNADNSVTISPAPANDSAIHIYEDVYFNGEGTALADQYLADDVAIEQESIFTFPINQRNENINLRFYSDSPFPISILSMVWEGQYSSKFIRRA